MKFKEQHLFVLFCCQLCASPIPLS